MEVRRANQWNLIGPLASLILLSMRISCCYQSRCRGVNPVNGSVEDLQSRSVYLEVIQLSCNQHSRVRMSRLFCPDHRRPRVGLVLSVYHHERQKSP